MKYLYLSLFAICLLICATDIAKAGDARIVIKVISGDTIIVDGGEPVRLLGVLAPRDDEYYAKEARQAVTTLLLGQEVELELDNTNVINGHKDSSGRKLAYVYRSSDRLFVNDVILAQGCGFYSSKNVRKNATRFQAEQLNAQKEHRGLWEKTEKSPEARAQDEHRVYQEPAFENKSEYKTPDLRVEILWAKKADPRVKIAHSGEEAKFLENLYKDTETNKGKLPPLVQLRKNLAEALTNFYLEQNVKLKVETSGEAAEVLRFVAEGMDQADADKFCAPFNREIFAGLEFKEVIFTDDDKFSYSYKVEQ